MFLITEFKRCRCCQETLPARNFNFVRARLGLASYCKECHNKKQSVSYVLHKEERLVKQSAYRDLNKEKIRESSKAYYEANKETLQERHNFYYAANKEKILARHAKNKDKKSLYAKANRPTINKRWRERAAVRRKTDPNFRLRKCLSNRIRHALKGVSKSKRTVELLGCSVTALRRHLEAQFRPEMTWENYGSVWHVDHIRPCASFDLTDLEQQKLCFHWTNLQPLFAVENIKKGDRVPST